MYMPCKQIEIKCVASHVEMPMIEPESRCCHHIDHYASRMAKGLFSVLM